jgi:hypothetical protein
MLKKQKRMGIRTMKKILSEVEFQLDSVKYNFEIVVIEGRPFLRAFYDETDIATGKVEVQYTRKWPLSFHMVKSEIVSNAFKCVITSAEHRTREHFKYRGRRIYSPHFDVDALWEIANKKDALDYRGKS